MRITTVIAGLTGGGAERVCVNLANAWAERGREVTILTVSGSSAPPAYDLDPRVALHDIGWPRRAHPDELNLKAITPVLRGLEDAGCFDFIEAITLVAVLRSAILATNPDLVVSHIDMTNIRTLAAMLGTRVPVIACEHTDTNRISVGRWDSSRQALYRQASAVVTPHHTISEFLAQRGAPAWTIPNPLVPPRSMQAHRKRKRRRLVTMGRLSPEKRPALAVRAFASLANSFPDWDLEIYGEGELRQPLAGLIEELAPGRIHLRGFAEAYSVLEGADLFASTSWVEGFGNSVWEALACGVPVVTMECGPPVRSLVRHGVDSLIVVPDNFAALAAALASLMGDEERRAALARRAPEVISRFSLESSLQLWEELIEKVMSRSPASTKMRGRATAGANTFV